MARVKIAQWLSNQNGFPRIADVDIERKTAKAIFVKGRGAVESPVHCFRCTRELTVAISQMVGIGPVCCEKLGIPWSADTSPEAIAELKAALIADSEFEGWLPLSQIELLEGSLDEVPNHTREAEPKPEVVSLEGTEGLTGWITISEWIAGEKGLVGTRIKGKVMRTSAKAILFRATMEQVTVEALTEQSKKDAHPSRTAGEVAEFVAQMIRWMCDDRDGNVKDGIVTLKLPKRKSSEFWLPASQILEVQLEQPTPRKPAKRKPTKIEAPLTASGEALDPEYKALLEANPLPF